MTKELEHIELKVRQLLDELNNLRQQNATLSTENQKLKADLAGNTERVGALTERLTNTQQAMASQRGDDDSESSQNLRKQIDQYITEIDKCIAWLQNA